MRGLGRRQQLSAVGDAALLLRIFAHCLDIQYVRYVINKKRKKQKDFLIDYGCVDRAERAPPTLNVPSSSDDTHVSSSSYGASNSCLPRSSAIHAASAHP